jgi:cytoskeletal protein CcmA (bactofilin family)
MSYYSPTGNPGTAAAGLSAAIRAEFAAIAAGFALLPNYAGNANKFVVVNSGGTGLTVTASPSFGALTVPSLHVTGNATFDTSIYADSLIAPPPALAQGTLLGRFAALHGTGVGWNLYQPDINIGAFNYRESLPAWRARSNPSTGVLEWYSAPAGTADTAATLTLTQSFLPDGSVEFANQLIVDGSAQIAGTLDFVSNASVFAGTGGNISLTAGNSNTSARSGHITILSGSQASGGTATTGDITLKTGSQSAGGISGNIVLQPGTGGNVSVVGTASVTGNVSLTGTLTVGNTITATNKITAGSMHITGTASFDSSMHVNGIQDESGGQVSILGGAAVSLGDLSVAPSGNNSGSLIVSVSDDGNPTGLAQGTLYGRFASLHVTGIGWNLYQPDQGAAIFNYRQSIPAWLGRTNNITGALEWYSAPAGTADTAATLTLTQSFLPDGSIMAASLHVGANQVVGARNIGYTAMTGVGDAGTVFDTTTVTLPQLASRVKALQAALTTHGLVGT